MTLTLSPLTPFASVQSARPAYDPASFGRVSAQMAASPAYRPDLFHSHLAPAPALPPAPKPVASVKFSLQLSDLRSGQGYLKAGDVGASVKHVQERLQAWGEDIKADSQFGTGTTQAVQRFQRAHGLEANGRVGQDTLAALDEAPPTAHALTLDALRSGAGILATGQQGEPVTHVQQRLRVWGYDVKVDGDFGPQTARMTQAFQTNQGLPAHGWVDQATLAALDQRRSAPKPRPAAAAPTGAAPAAPALPEGLSLSAIRAGQSVLKNGERGEAVEHVQSRLQTWGYTTKVDGDFGPNTAEQVRRFQRNQGIQANGQVGKTTLAALDKAPPPAVLSQGVRSTTAGQRLASVAQRVANNRNTVGWCYTAVADSVSRAIGVSLWGKSAYMAAPILAQNDKIREVKGVKASTLPKLPAGAIVVWGKTGVSPHGHISVALGDGREASDHIDRQRTQLRGHTNFRVFMPA